MTAAISSIRRLTAIGATALVLLVSGCANMTDTQRNTAVGAGIGAAVGGIVGGDGGDALLGAGLGALGGYGYSKMRGD